MERTSPFEVLLQTAQAYLRVCQAKLDKEYRLWQ